MHTDDELKKEIERLQDNLKKTHEESLILNAILRALKKLQEKRGIKDEEKELTNLEEQLKNL